TPVVDRQRGIVYLIASDGRLHGVALQTGNEELTPVEFVPPYSRNWSLNLVNGVLYTTVGRGCGNAPGQTARTSPSVDITPADPRLGRADGAAAGRQGQGRGRGVQPPPTVVSQMVAMDLNDPKRPISKFVASVGRPSGAWSRAGMAWADNSLLVQT